MSKAKKTTQTRTRYDAAFTRIAEGVVSRYGYDPANLAAILGVAEETVRKWAENRADFREAVRVGKERFEALRPDAEKIRLAEEALFQKVIGHQWEETKIVKSEKGVEETVTRGQIAPDVAAIRYFLKNRCPERWKDRQEVAISGGVPMVVLDMGDGSEIAANATVETEKEIE